MTDPMSRVIETRYGPAPTQPPLVSVLMITYNHEAFIREAIESVFMQEVDFPIELVIGEDCSTDRTRDLIVQVCAAAPIQVRMLTSERNVGMHENFRRTLGACRGEFVALLEGDDYWLLEEKLKLQVRALQRSDRLQMMFNRSRIEFVGDAHRALLPVNHQHLPTFCSRTFEFKEILNKDFLIPTASVLFRRCAIGSIPSWVTRLPFVDEVVFLLASRRGTVVYDDTPVSVYRVHAGGVSSEFDYENLSEARIAMLMAFLRSEIGELEADVLAALRARVRALAYWYETRGNALGALRVLTGLARSEVKLFQLRRTTIVWWLRLRFPKLYVLIKTMVVG